MNLLSNVFLFIFSYSHCVQTLDPRGQKMEVKRGFSYINAFPKHGHMQFWDQETQTLLSAVYFSILAEGPPGCAHGEALSLLHCPLNISEGEREKLNLLSLLFFPLWKGGSIAASFDHLFGSYVFRAFGLGHYTVNLSVDYKKFIKLNTTVRAVLGLVRKEGRKIFVKAVVSAFLRYLLKTFVLF